MKILLIDNSNLTDYPFGGIVTFFKSLIDAFGTDLILVGFILDDNIPTGKWSKRCIDGKSYDYFSLGKIEKKEGKPLIPDRVRYVYKLYSYMRKIMSCSDYDQIFIQTQEPLLFMNDGEKRKTTLLMPGVSNALSLSRYKWIRPFAPIYDRIFMPRIAKCRKWMAAADINARKGFAERSNGLINYNDIICFPTRYSDKYYYVRDKRKCREILDWNLENIIFVTVGRLNWFKGWKFMIDAFKRFNMDVPTSKLVFIGDGEDKDKIKEYIKSLSLDINIILEGRKEPMAICTYLNAADAFIMGSYVEGWSTTVVEACACGVPCVLTNFSSAKDMVKNGENGYIIDERDEMLFSKRMKDALLLDRKEVAVYDERYKIYGLSNLKEQMLEIFK